MYYRFFQLKYLVDSFLSLTLSSADLAALFYQYTSSLQEAKSVFGSVVDCLPLFQNETYKASVKRSVEDREMQLKELVRIFF